MLFGAITSYYDEKNPTGEILKFKEMVAGILGCSDENAIPEMNALLEKVLPLRPLRDCGFTEVDAVEFPQSVAVNQQRLMTNAYYPLEIEDMEKVYRSCF
jgi:4-hydroxybutyrate dehydrogenase